MEYTNKINYIHTIISNLGIAQGHHIISGAAHQFHQTIILCTVVVCEHQIFCPVVVVVETTLRLFGQLAKWLDFHDIAWS
jgi:hypothetical protein